MKVKDLLDVQEVLEKRKTPCDMHNTELNEHYSTSKDRHINILDMDLIHLVRSYSKCLGMGKISNINLIEQQLSNIESSISTIKDQFYS